MKKLLTICLIMATVFTVNAQDKKPTKEETIAYLDKVVKMSVGYKTYAVGGPVNEEERRVEEHLITNYSFSELKVDRLNKTKRYKNNSSGISQTVFSNLNWENVTAIKINSLEEDKLTNDSLYQDEELEEFRIEFSNKIMMDLGDGELRPRIYLNVYVLKIKTESFKKALERLVEIAKEENKDPFKD